MTKLMPGTIIELSIDSLTSAGDGVGRYQGLAVFVAGALPGEQVQARVSQVKKRYARAGLLAILQASPWRVAPACPRHTACGGCVLQHLAYEQQLQWKRRWLKEALARIGGVDVSVLPTLPASGTFAYRSRVQLHVSQQDGEVNLGFYARGSRELTGQPAQADGWAGNPAQLAPCMLMRPLLTDLARLLRAELPHICGLEGLRHVALRCDSAGERAMLIWQGLPASGDLRKLSARLMAAEPRLISVWANWGQAVYGIYGDQWLKLAGCDKLPDSLAGLKLEISPAAFTQVYPEQALRLYERVAAYADLQGGETLLDIYSGSGVIALYLAQQAQRVIGVEEYAPAVADAARNAVLNGLTNCSFEAGPAEEVLPRLAAAGLTADVAVLDPPRAGCEAAALTALAALAPARIVYVSCDPATLARDVRLLAELGYAVREARPVDMFPHTGHVEAIVALQRKNM